MIKLDKNGKPKKVRREKIRFGQAPEQALPPGPMAASTGTDRGAGSAPAAGSGASLAPGTTTTVDRTRCRWVKTTSARIRWHPKAAPAAKTRYAARAQFVKAKKIKVKKDKAADKVLATPTAMTTQEKQAQQVQAAPLGLNGDTAKKKKKKRVKGEAKQRLQPKPKDPNAVPQKNPDGTYPTPYHPADENKPAAPAPSAAGVPQPSNPIRLRLRRSRLQSSKEHRNARASALALCFYAPTGAGMLEVYERVLCCGCGEVRQ